MVSIQQHRDATKALRKAPRSIQEKTIEWITLFLEQGHFKGCRFDMVPMKGKFKIYREVKLDRDYRIIFRIEEEVLFIRYAGTHNQLGTG